MAECSRGGSITDTRGKRAGAAPWATYLYFEYISMLSKWKDEEKLPKRSELQKATRLEKGEVVWVGKRVFAFSERRIGGCL